MKRQTHNALAYYQFDSLDEARVTHGIFTRLGGVSEGCYASLNLSRSTGDAAEPVNENRARMNDTFGLPYEDTLTSWLVHGNRVRVVTWDDRSQNDVHADAMVTRAPGLALTLRFADCVPVLFHDPIQKAIGIAHAGWPGIACQVLPQTVATMQAAFGSQPQDILACVGPSIGPAKFEVGLDVAEKIQAAVPEDITLAHPDPHKHYMDLWRAAQSQLNKCGVQAVEIAGLCTASNTHEWFSHRAEKGKTGRFGALIQLS
ncbi:MAG: peptidoglycan editing factor PgeF [Anaerolineae bacterium]|nr:peptidoglycan editing factor PgeF [Anaerolineae bacterium]